MKRNRNPVWWPVATVSLALFLSACSSGPPVSNADTPPEEEKPRRAMGSTWQVQQTLVRRGREDQSPWEVILTGSKAANEDG